ncbi:hypothetical protein Droror1_Dr00003103 [Drosera rotundifolia]
MHILVSNSKGAFPVIILLVYQRLERWISYNEPDHFALYIHYCNMKDALTTASSISFGSGQSLSNSYIVPLWPSFSARLDQEQAVAVPFNDASRIFEYQVSCPFSVTHGCCMMKRCPAFCIL